MNEAARTARRYHWHSASVRDFTADPHSAIVGAPAGTIRNLVDARAKPAQDALLAIAREDPSKTLHEVNRLTMPSHHEFAPRTSQRTSPGSGPGTGARAQSERLSASFLLVEQLGPRTLQSLALVAEVVHGTPTRFDDPARFVCARRQGRASVPRAVEVYDESIAVPRRSLDAAKLGHSDKLDGMSRLDKFARNIEEHFDPSADVAATIAHERRISRELGGRGGVRRSTAEQIASEEQRTTETVLRLAILFQAARRCGPGPDTTPPSEVPGPFVAGDSRLEP